jgi:hypothetical protein
MLLTLASVRNITVKDARTLNYAGAVSLATCEREKNSIFSPKMGIRQDLEAR